MKQFGLTKDERIKSRALYENTFLYGKRFDSNEKLLRISVLISHSEKPGIKISFAINKKHGNAPWRNRVKRIIREIYRLNKTEILNNATANGISASVIFITNRLRQENYNKINYNQLLPDVLSVINKINKEIIKN